MEADASQNQSLLLSMLLSMPAATALIALAVPIVRVLFERGAFGGIDTLETAKTLIWFSAGLPAYVLIRVLQPGFFAREDTRPRPCSPASRWSSTSSLSLVLFPFLAHVGIAIATSVAAWANVALLAIWLGRRGHFRLAAGEWRRHFLIIADFRRHGRDALGAGHSARRHSLPSMRRSSCNCWRCGGLVSLGLAVYFGLAHVSGAQRLDLVLNRLRRRGSKG